MQTSEEYEAIKRENDFLEEEDVHLIFGKTQKFAMGVQVLKSLFDFLNFSDFNKPFRITLDYNPEQLNVAIKKCSPKELGE